MYAVVFTSKLRDPAWRAHPEHAEAQRRGAQDWYESYDTIVCEVLGD